MEENTKAVTAAPEQLTVAVPPPAQTQPKTRNKVIERVKVKLTGAGSCMIDDLTVRKNEIIELEASRSEKFIKSGLFVRA